MKESISYTFLLNIIILFITVCAAIVAGIFSYYKAFRANSIISETIEKYEGFNCVSKQEIALKLSSIGYNTPFNVKCKSSDGNCETDSDTDGSYKVISYNLDFDGNYIYGENMNSTYKCENKNGTRYCTTNKHYQYGIYTYMYVELPVISNLIRLTYYSKTNPLYEFRNFYVEDTIDSRNNNHTITTDVESIFENLYEKENIDGKTYVKDAYKGTEITETANQILAEAALKLYSYLSAGKITNQYNYEYLFQSLTNVTGENYRVREMIQSMYTASEGFGSIHTNIINRGVPRNKCGFIRDYSLINREKIGG